MKNGKLMYLFVVIILFVLLIVPYFQNAAINPPIAFFIDMVPLLTGYKRIVTIGIGIGVMITLYIQSIIKQTNITEPERFNLE